MILFCSHQWDNWIPILSQNEIFFQVAGICKYWLTHPLLLNLLVSQASVSFYILWPFPLNWIPFVLWRRNKAVSLYWWVCKTEFSLFCMIYKCQVALIIIIAVPRCTSKRVDSTDWREYLKYFPPKTKANFALIINS